MAEAIPPCAHTHAMLLRHLENGESCPMNRNPHHFSHRRFMWLLNFCTFQFALQFSNLLTLTSNLLVVHDFIHHSFF